VRVFSILKKAQKPKKIGIHPEKIPMGRKKTGLGKNFSENFALFIIRK
jgi:hypothetical protein